MKHRKWRTYFRAKWTAFAIAVQSAVDVGDLIYVGSVLLVASGAGQFHLGAGLICAGLGSAFPFVLVMLRGVKPTKKDDP
jgi:hypothetical protein